MRRGTVMVFDRDQTPVRFAVVTSVASGLLVAAVTSVVRDVSGSVLWLVVALVGIAALTWLGSSVFFRARRHSRAFLMTSAFSQKYYLAALVQRLHGALEADGVDLVLKVPDRDYDAGAQSQHLNRILRRRHEYVGGIILAGEVDQLRDDLVTFCRRSRLPVVFTDVEPFDAAADYPPNSVFVGYDTGELGAAAGRWVADRLRGTFRPHVLIVASTEHPARQTRCEQVLRAELGDVVIAVDDKCEFTRSKAYAAVRAHLRQLGRRQRLDAVVCTNDEMALGAVDAVTPSSPATVVVGIDGVLEAKALIDSGDSPLRATVVQDTHRLAVRIVAVLEKMQRGRPVPNRTVLPFEVYENR